VTPERFEEISKIVHDIMERVGCEPGEFIINTYEACALGDLLKEAERGRGLRAP